MTRRTVPAIAAGLSALAVSAISGLASAQDVMLIPDSVTDAVWAFDAADGSFITDSFITDPGTDDNGTDILNRPLEVAISQSGTLLVSDQFADLVAEFAADGSFMGVFSLGGTVDGSVLQNVRGLHVVSSGPLAGQVLVANAGSTNSFVQSRDNIIRLDTASGSRLRDFARQSYGGLGGPFDVVEFGGEILVASESNDSIIRYDLATGRFRERFTSDFDVEAITFPQQLAATPGGTLLVCEFSQGVILEFNSAGTLIGQYDPGTLSLYRGIAELGNGNLLVTTTTGVYEVTRGNIVVDTEATGSGFRYVTQWTPPAPLTPRPGRSLQTRPIEPDTRTLAEIIADERGLTRADAPQRPARTRGTLIETETETETEAGKKTDSEEDNR